MQVKFQGNPMTLIGTELKVGDHFPDFIVLDNGLKPISLKDTKGVRVFSAVPSIDTPVCDLETRTFNKKSGELQDVIIYTISMDLPFAQSRWCAKNGISNVITLSDYKDRTFGKVTGTFMDELALLARAVFVVDSNNIVTYVEYVAEVTEQPNFDAVLEAAKKAE